jgi:hypothetical protein
VRLISLIAVTAVVCIVTLAQGAAASTTKPSLRVGASPQLLLVGAGFRPRSLVTLRVVSTTLTRRVVVRTGSRGGFTYRFPSIDRCDPTSVVAEAANGLSARVPVTWFTRSCISPPPIQPGVPPPQD